MRTRTFLRAHFLTVLVTYLAFFLSFSVSAEQQTYDMQCKAGGTSYLRFPSLEGQFKEFDGTVVEYTFRKSSEAAPAGLEPGECAWIDRPISSNEPTSIRFIFENTYLSLFVYDKNFNDGDFVWYGAKSRTDEAKKEQLDKLLSVIKNGGSFTASVYSEDGVLNATSVQFPVALKMQFKIQDQPPK